MCCSNSSPQTARVDRAPRFVTVSDSESLGHLKAFRGEFGIETRAAKAVIAAKLGLSVPQEMENDAHDRSWFIMASKGRNELPILGAQNR